MSVFDVRELEVHRLVQERKPEGPYSMHWDGKDDFDRILASGIDIGLLIFHFLNLSGYICRLEARV